MFSIRKVSRIKKIFVFLVGLIFLLSVWFVNRVIYNQPEHVKSMLSYSNLVRISPTHFTLNNNWIRLNKYGNWECYIEGNGYERGRTLGILQDQLGEQQEEIFLNEIDKKIPSWFLKKVLILGISWFNRDLNLYIPQEYRDEIFGISEFFSDNFDHIGPKYNRIINYHAAHDIGHAIQNMHIVGCTAFGTWNFDSTNQQMIIGRNFDFYVGDEFAKNKIVLLSNPTQGYKSISVTWPSFIGVVSGINEKGLGITLNSNISEIPSKSGTPVSIIARDILQYASTIQEALEISNKYTSFVSESFTISSAIDQKIAVIEKTPTTTDVYYSQTDTIIVTNHFQSKKLKNLALNLAHMKTSESVKRYNRTTELINRSKSLDYKHVANILRNQKGENDQDIGLGNPLALNQLLAHHAVIFDNLHQFIWVSTYPYQINTMNAYELKNFDSWKTSSVVFPIVTDSLHIAPDPFYGSKEFNQFKKFKRIKLIILNATKNKANIDKNLEIEFAQSNSEYYDTYKIMGDYYMALNNFEKAKHNYLISLSKEIAYQEDKKYINAQIAKINLDD